MVKLTLDVNTHLCFACLSVCGPVMDRFAVQDVPPLGTQSWDEVGIDDKWVLEEFYLLSFPNF